MKAVRCKLKITDSACLSKVIQFNLPFLSYPASHQGSPVLLSGLLGSTPMERKGGEGGRMGSGEKPGGNADSVKAHSAPHGVLLQEGPLKGSQAK